MTTWTTRSDHNDWVVVLHPTQHKIAHFRDIPQANLLAWYGKTKPKTTKACIHHQKKWTTTQSKHTKKTKARFNRLVWHPAWKWRGPTLVLVPQISHVLTYLDIYPLTYSTATHTGLLKEKLCGQVHCIATNQILSCHLISSEWNSENEPKPRKIIHSLVLFWSINWLIDWLGFNVPLNTL